MSRSQSGEEKDNRLLFGVDVRYCSPNPTGGGFFNQSGAELRIQDGGVGSETVCSSETWLRW